MGDTTATDNRYAFIEDYVLKTMKLKPDRWQKCIGTEEYKQPIQGFLDRTDQFVLVVSLSAAGQLTTSAEFPASSKNKAVYFVKKSKDALTSDSIKSNLVYGDLSYAPLEQFSSLVEEVRCIFNVKTSQITSVVQTWVELLCTCVLQRLL